MKRKMEKRKWRKPSKTSYKWDQKRKRDQKREQEKSMKSTWNCSRIESGRQNE
jgi:hypothetical protein